MPNPIPEGEERAERRKPHNVAVAELEAWQDGYIAARTMKNAFVNTRHSLLERGFPPGHALCQDLDEGAAKWAAHEAQMHRDGLRYARDNLIEFDAGP